MLDYQSKRSVHVSVINLATENKMISSPTPTALRIRFTRKPVNLEDVLNNADPDDTSSAVRIELTKALTPSEYDRFADTLLEDRDWLKGRGGHATGQARNVVEVTAPGRTTLYVDPSGSAYGRYVGVEANAQPHDTTYSTQQFTVDEVGFIQIALTKVLAAVARGELDLNQLAREELANRGLDKNGAWVGFDRANQIHLGAQPTKTRKSR